MKILISAIAVLFSFSAFAGTLSMGTSPFDFAEGGTPTVGQVKSVNIFGVDPSIAVNEASLFVQGTNGTSCSISASLIQKHGMSLGQLAMLLTNGDFNIACVNDTANGMKTTQIVEISK